MLLLQPLAQPDLPPPSPALPPLSGQEHDAVLGAVPHVQHPGRPAGRHLLPGTAAVRFPLLHARPARLCWWLDSHTLSSAVIPAAQEVMLATAPAAARAGIAAGESVQTLVDCAHPMALPPAGSCPRCWACSLSSLLAPASTSPRSRRTCPTPSTSTASSRWWACQTSCAASLAAATQVRYDQQPCLSRLPAPVEFAVPSRLLCAATHMHLVHVVIGQQPGLLLSCL